MKTTFKQSDIVLDVVVDDVTLHLVRSVDHCIESHVISPWDVIKYSPTTNRTWLVHEHRFNGLAWSLKSIQFLLIH